MSGPLQLKEREGERKMAFKEIADKMEFKKLTDLEEGDSLTGYLYDVQESSQIEGAYTLVMMIEGNKIGVSAAGNVKWAAKDGKLVNGANTRFTRQADTKSKGKKTTSFKIEQDLEDMLEGYVPRQAQPTASIADKIAKLKG